MRSSQTGCVYSKEAPGNDPGRCPRCNMRLLAKPLPRHVRFHDLRHTTATLLLKMGVPLVTVQRTVYRLVAEGQLPAVRVSSGAIRVRDSGLLGRGK